MKNALKRIQNYAVFMVYYIWLSIYTLNYI